MKLLVVVETLYGSPRTLSIERTLSAPEPIPRRPETAPATTISSHAGGKRRGKYACSPPARDHRANYKNDPHFGTLPLPFLGYNRALFHQNEILCPTMPYYLKIGELRGTPKYGPTASRHDRSPPHPSAMGHLRHGRHRLRVRHLRFAGLAADRAARPDGNRQGQAGHTGLQLLGGPALLHPRGGGWHLRPVGRISHRPARPPPCAGLEHPALRLLGPGVGTGQLRRRAAGAALHYVHWRFRGICSCRGMAGGVVPGRQAARSRAGLYAGVFVGGRIANQ